MASSSRVGLTRYSAATGAPEAGASLPTWSYFKNLSDGSARTPQPTIRNDGGGAYSFAHGLAEGEAFQGLVDYGADASPRYERITLRYEETLEGQGLTTGTTGTWTYTASPSTSTRDEVRLLLGDTDSGDPQLADAEITYYLNRRSSNAYLAAADAALALAAKYARKADFTNGELSVSASQRAAAYRRLAADLQTQARSLSAASPFMGGQSVSGMESLRQDSDTVQPAFSVGMDDYPSGRFTEGRSSES